MTNDPYQDPYLAPEVPANPTRRKIPIAVDPEERHATFRLPNAIAVALMIALGYFFYGHVSNVGPNVRADSGAMMKVEPSPN